MDKLEMVNSKIKLHGMGALWLSCGVFFLKISSNNIFCNKRIGKLLLLKFVLSNLLLWK